MWQFELTYYQKRKIVEIIVRGKGVIPYKKIKTIDSRSFQPENGIFLTKNEFHSMLKGCAVDDVEYNNSKTLYSLLKMHNLSDLNDLYNVQDVI